MAPPRFGEVGAYKEFGHLSPPPTPEFLTKDFCLQPGLKLKFLLRRTWLEHKLLPLQFPGPLLPYSGEPGFLTKDLLLPWVHPESDGKSSDVGVGGRIGIPK